MDFDSYLLFIGLGLVFAGNHRTEMHVEKMVKLLSKRRMLVAIRVLHACSTHDSLEELTLEHDFCAGMDVIRFDSETIVELLEVLFLLILVAAT